MRAHLARAIFIVLLPLAIVAVVLSTIGLELWRALHMIYLELRVEFASLGEAWRRLP